MVDVHSTALIHENAEIGVGVSVGPFAVVHEGAKVGDHVVLDAHTHVLPGTSIGARTRVHTGAVLGGEPQDLSFDAQLRTRTIIGADCTLRENVTIHRATQVDHATSVGDNCLLMAGAHVAHDCLVHDHVILCNNSLLGGHVEVRQGAFLSGNSAVHQFVRVGEGVMLSGISGIGKDAPPYTMIAERSAIVGLNIVGLRRAGVDGPTRLAIKKLYKIVLHETDASERERALAEAPDFPEIQIIRDFYAAPSKRGFCMS